MAIFIGGGEEWATLILEQSPRHMYLRKYIILVKCQQIKLFSS